MVFKTQSPESALPKELLRLGLAGKDGGLGEGGGGGGAVLWLLGLIAKKDMSCLLITQVHAGDNHLILSSSLNWSIPHLSSPATGQTLTQTLGGLICVNTQSLSWIPLVSNITEVIPLIKFAGYQFKCFDVGADMIPGFRW